jgi:hypothetical protein
MNTISKMLSELKFTEAELAAGHVLGCNLDGVRHTLIQQVHELRNHLGQLANHMGSDAKVVRALMAQL